MSLIEHCVLFHDPLSAPSAQERSIKSLPGRGRGTPAAEESAPASVPKRPQAVAAVLRDLKALQSRRLTQGQSAPVQGSGELPDEVTFTGLDRFAQPASMRR